MQMKMKNFQLINIDKAFLTDVLGVPYKTQYDMIKFMVKAWNLLYKMALLSS